jgi:hypothetical protein
MLPLFPDPQSASGYTGHHHRIAFARMWFYAVASMKIPHSDALVSQAAFRHDRVDNMREIPFDAFAERHVLSSFEPIDIPGHP